jgi:hypothetical protein
MKLAVLGTLAGIGLMAAVGGALEVGDNSPVVPQPTTSVAQGAGGDLIVVPLGTSEKGILLSVVDTRQRVMSVYRIEPASGKIALKSVRNLRWDLQMNDFNNDAPLPREIQSLIEQK